MTSSPVETAGLPHYTFTQAHARGLYARRELVQRGLRPAGPAAGIVQRPTKDGLSGGTDHLFTLVERALAVHPRFARSSSTRTRSAAKFQ